MSLHESKQSPRQENNCAPMWMFAPMTGGLEDLPIIVDAEDRDTEASEQSSGVPRRLCC